MTLLKILKSEKDIGYINGIYKQVQVLFTHNSNKIEGSKLTLEQTRSIFEYNTIDISSNTLNINDIIETTNHFQCIDYIINNAARQLSESIIKKLHKTLYTGINLKNRKWFKIGEYKKKPNTVADIETTTPEDTPEAVRNLLLQYKWWNLPIRRITEILPQLCSANLDEVRKFIKRELLNQTA